MLGRAQVPIQIGATRPGGEALGIVAECRRTIQLCRGVAGSVVMYVLEDEWYEPFHSPSV